VSGLNFLACGRNIGLLVVVGSIGCRGEIIDQRPTDTDDNPDGVAQIEVTPCDWDFGLAEIDSIISKSFRVNNAGGEELTVTELVVDGPFSVQGTTPITITGGSSYQFSVRFQPTEYGVFEAQLSVLSDAPNGEDYACNLHGEVLSDADGDGYSADVAGGDDCDDENAAVHPDAEEVWYDGLDQNCDGLDDFDQDGDGFQTSVFNEESTAGGGDCQDVNPDIYPGAPDEWYDGIDSDCESDDDFDQDGDGFRSDSFGGEDCADTDPEIHPDALELFNGEDENCNGLLDENILGETADVRITGSASTDRAGNSVVVGDFDGNSQPDLVIGVKHEDYVSGSTSWDIKGEARGAIAVFMNGSWEDGDIVGYADNYFKGRGSREEFGYAVVNVGDFDGDEKDDLGVGAAMGDNNTGRAYVFSGAGLGTTSNSGALITVTGATDMRLGLNIGTTQDLNGDGFADLVAYGTGLEATKNYLGVLYGGDDVSGDFDWDDLDASWAIDCDTVVSPYYYYNTCGEKSWSSSDADGGNEAWQYNGNRKADFDGDGYQDLILADSLNDQGADNAGRVWMLWGKGFDYSTTDSSIGGTASIVLSGETVDQRLGYSADVIEDVDGDGADEFLVYSEEDSKAYFFLGGSYLHDGTLDLIGQSQAVLDLSAYAGTLTRVVNAGDWSGDGVDDIALGMGKDAGSEKGRVIVLERFAWEGTFDPAEEAVVMFTGGSDFGELGAGLSAYNADLNGDGAADLALGDPGFDGNTGSVTMFFHY
jgi:hypothetical protein